MLASTDSGDEIEEVYDKLFEVLNKRITKENIIIMGDYGMHQLEKGRRIYLVGVIVDE